MAATDGGFGMSRIAEVPSCEVTKTGAVRPGDLLTVPPTLALVPVGRSTLYKLISDGHISVRTTGSRRGVEELRDGGPKG